MTTPRPAIVADIIHRLLDHQEGPAPVPQDWLAGYATGLEDADPQVPAEDTPTSASDGGVDLTAQMPPREDTPRYVPCGPEFEHQEPGGRRGIWDRQAGEVKEFAAHDADQLIWVADSLSNGGNRAHFTWSPAPTPTPTPHGWVRIDPADIKVGDRVRRERSHSDATTAHEGVVHRLDADGDPVTAGGQWIGSLSSGTWYVWREAEATTPTDVYEARVDARNRAERAEAALREADRHAEATRGRAHAAEVERDALAEEIKRLKDGPRLERVEWTAAEDTYWHLYRNCEGEWHTAMWPSIALRNGDTKAECCPLYRIVTTDGGQA